MCSVNCTQPTLTPPQQQDALEEVNDTSPERVTQAADEVARVSEQIETARPQPFHHDHIEATQRRRPLTPGERANAERRVEGLHREAAKLHGERARNAEQRRMWVEGDLYAQRYEGVSMQGLESRLVEANAAMRKARNPKDAYRLLNQVKGLEKEIAAREEILAELASSDDALETRLDNIDGELERLEDHLENGVPMRLFDLLPQRRVRRQLEGARGLQPKDSAVGGFSLRSGR